MAQIWLIQLEPGDPSWMGGAPVETPARVVQQGNDLMAMFGGEVSGGALIGVGILVLLRLVPTISKIIEGEHELSLDKRRRRLVEEQSDAGDAS